MLQYVVLILDAQQQGDHGGGDVVADELPAGALDVVAVFAIKTELCQEPISGRF